MLKQQELHAKLQMEKKIRLKEIGSKVHMKSFFAKRVKSTKCNFEKIDILYHIYLTSFQFVFILCDESRHLLEINYMVV